MKFEDVKEGQTLAWGNHKSDYTVIFKNEKGFIWKTIDAQGYHESYKSMGDFKIVIPKKKVWCSLWGQNSSYTWCVSHHNRADYDKLLAHYKQMGYFMIKEWELEYESPNSRP